MLPLVGAKVENETKDCLYLWGEVGRFDVAESEYIWKHMKRCLKLFEANKWETVEPEEEQLELGCKVGVGEQVVQRVKVPAQNVD